MAEKYETILETPTSRREVMKKAAYMAPAILTLTAVPTFAAKGSGWQGDKGKKDKPPKHHKGEKEKD